MYLGCGAVGRIALALKDQAKFCAEIRLVTPYQLYICKV